jgi:hypothetical protein
MPAKHVATEEFKVSILKALEQPGVLHAYAHEAFVTTMANRTTDIPIQDEGESTETNGPDIEPDSTEGEGDSQRKSNLPTSSLFRRHR